MNTNIRYLKNLLLPIFYEFVYSYKNNNKIDCNNSCVTSKFWTNSFNLNMCCIIKTSFFSQIHNYPPPLHQPPPIYHLNNPTIPSNPDEGPKKTTKRGVLPKLATEILRSWLFSHIVVCFFLFFHCMHVNN